MTPLSDKDIKDLAYWARRYADGRSTYVTTSINNIIDKMIDKGIYPEKDDTLLSRGGLYVSDGMFGFWVNGVWVKEEKQNEE